MAVRAHQLVSAQDISTTYTGGAYNVAAGQFALEVVFAGSPNGSLAVQESLSGDNWSAVPFRDSAGTVASSLSVTVAGATILRLTDWYAEYVRLVYTATSGSGTMSAWIRER